MGPEVCPASQRRSRATLKFILGVQLAGTVEFSHFPHFITRGGKPLRYLLRSYRDANRHAASGRWPETVVGKLGKPPVPSAPSARPGCAAGGGGRAARGADLRAGMRPGDPENAAAAAAP
eukprot:gene17954-biopygen15946